MYGGEGKLSLGLSSSQPLCLFFPFPFPFSQILENDKSLDHSQLDSEGLPVALDSDPLTDKNQRQNAASC
jgi:hypothetical protein